MVIEAFDHSVGLRVALSNQSVLRVVLGTCLVKRMMSGGLAHSSERVGVAADAGGLGLQSSQIYQWRAEAQPRKSVAEREQALADENSRLKRQMAEMAEGLAIAKKAVLRSTDYGNIAALWRMTWQDEGTQKDSPQARSRYCGSSGKRIGR